MQITVAQPSASDRRQMPDQHRRLAMRCAAVAPGTASASAEPFGTMETMMPIREHQVAPERNTEQPAQAEETDPDHVATTANAPAQIGDFACSGDVACRSLRQVRDLAELVRVPVANTSAR